MFFFPFSDDNPTQNTPYVTYFLIGVCCFIFLWQFTLPPQLFESAVYNFGVVPASLLGSKEGYLLTGDHDHFYFHVHARRVDASNW